MIVALALQALDFNMNTGVSVAIIIVLIGAVWKLSSALTEIKNDTKNIRIMNLRMRHIENHLMIAEEDMNNLWAATRTSAADGARILTETRRARFIPLEDQA